jgi:apolipoprotein N-acyltransferase
MDAAESQPLERKPHVGFRTAAWVMLAGAAIFGVSAATGDPWFFLIALLGPLSTGLVMRVTGRRWQLGATAWALYGLYSLVFDWVVNDEDKAFHVVLTLVMVGLVALGAGLGSVAARVSKPKERR